jgi:hypothetical protein
MNARSIKVFEKILSDDGTKSRRIIARVAYNKKKGYVLEVDPVTREKVAGGTMVTEQYALFSGLRRVIDTAPRYNAKAHERLALACQVEPLASALLGMVKELEGKEVAA